MKLRNKKTGEIWDIGKVLVNDYPCWETLTQICEDWEDVKEPLIKDEKIRKAVRAWAEVVPSAQVRYVHDDGRFYAHSDYIQPYNISFPIRLELEEMTDYTIAELCGEEEE